MRAALRGAQVLAFSLWMLATGCTSDGAQPLVEPSVTSAPTFSPTTVSSTTVPPTTVSPTTVPPTTVPPTTVAPTTVPPTTVARNVEAERPPYASNVSEISAALEAEMTPTSWREQCPVTIDELRLVEVLYIDYDNNVANGRLIVHRDHAAGLAQVFGVLYDAAFPLQSVELVDTFGGDDQTSMKANNTSAFNCREVAYTPGRWSNHAFGTAIDINPLVNPYVSGDFVDPEEGRRYTDRSVEVVGLIRPDDVVVRAFADIGWIWGGTWSSAKDYQHFSANGR